MATSSGLTDPKIILITGASSGFGLMTAHHLAIAGHVVYASMRHEDHETRKSIADFSSKNNCTMKPLVLDVTSEESCSNAIAEILRDSKHLDVVIHNAGHMCYGPAESFSPEAYMQYYNVNCLGPQRLNMAVLPHMRSRRDGLVVWIGSTSTRGGTPPFLAPYFAAKAAMDSLAVSYSVELSRFGIETSIILPGAFTSGTNHFANAGKPDVKDIEEQYLGEGKPYYGVSEEVLKGLASLEPASADPEEVARQVVRVVGEQKGKRPFRVHIDPSNDGAEAVNEVGDQKRLEFYKRIGMEDMLKTTA